jgi:hypothetical protein
VAQVQVAANTRQLRRHIHGMTENWVVGISLGQRSLLQGLQPSHCGTSLGHTSQRKNSVNDQVLLPEHGVTVLAGDV